MAHSLFYSYYTLHCTHRKLNKRTLIVVLSTWATLFPKSPYTSTFEGKNIADQISGFLFWRCVFFRKEEREVTRSVPITLITEHSKRLPKSGELLDNLIVRQLSGPTARERQVETIRLTSGEQQLPAPTRPTGELTPVCWLLP